VAVGMTWIVEDSWPGGTNSLGPPSSAASLLCGEQMGNLGTDRHPRTQQAVPGQTQGQQQTCNTHKHNLGLNIS
jgi:hypothetical protein